MDTRALADLNKQLTSKPSLHQKILHIQKNVGLIERKGNNPGCKSNYAKIEDVVAKLLPLFQQQNILHINETIVLPTVMNAEFIVTSAVKIRLIDVDSSEEISSTIPLIVRPNPLKHNEHGQPIQASSAMQAWNGSNTTAHRVGILTMLGLISGVDNDGEADEPENKSNPRAEMIKSIKILWPQVREKGMHASKKKTEYIDKLLDDDFRGAHFDFINDAFVWLNNGCPSTVVKKEAA